MVKNKNFGFWNRMYSLFNVMAKASEFNNNLSHYRISFSNSKGNNLIYDSETDTIIDGDSEEEEEQDEEKKEEQQEEDEKEKEDEKEDENGQEKEDEGSDTDSTGANDSSNFISYSSLFFLALLLLI